MMFLKVEQTDHGLALVLDEEARRRLAAAAGQEIRCEITGEAELALHAPDDGFEDRHARGRAFLRRYQRGFTGLGV